MSGDAIQLIYKAAANTVTDGVQVQARADSTGALVTSGTAQIVDVNGLALDYTLPAICVEFAAVATTSTVASTTTSFTMLSTNSARLRAAVYNSDANAMLIKYGATASATSFSYRIKSGETWDMPWRYAGQIDAIWETAGVGTAFITSLTTA